MPPRAPASPRALALAGSLAAALAAAACSSGAGSSAPPSTSSSSPRAPSSSLADLRRDPLGVQADGLAFSWALDHPDRDERQTAYRILVASSEANLDAGIGDLWDSGKVPSARSTNVPYGGTPLEPERTHWWKVRWWDSKDEPSPWGATSRFSVAPDPLTAEFVWDESENPNDYCYLRRTFTLPTGASEAFVAVSAHDEYRLWVNGELVGDGPAQSDPRVSMQLDSWDVAALLRPGANVFAVRAHWHGLGGVAGVRAEPAFLLRARVLLDDATERVVETDSRWKVLDTTPWDESSPVRGPFWAQATSAEYYDARAEVDGWNELGFDDSGWAPATVVRPGYALVPNRFPRQVRSERVSPVSVAEYRPGVYLVDFGQNLSGWPVLTVRSATPGTEVTVYYSEELDASGTAIVRDRNGITDYHDRYTCRGGAEETFEPDVRYNGFRYVEIEGYPGVLAAGDVVLERVRGELDVVDDFRCSNPLVQDVYEISVRTQLNAVQQVLVDCPQREQTQYLSDMVFQGHNLAWNVRDFGLLRKPIQDFVTTALGGSLLLASSPSEDWLIIPEWSLHMPASVWLEYWLYDDPSVLASAYPVIESNLDTFDLYRDPATNLLTDVPGNQPFSDSPGSSIDMSCPALTPQNCLYYGALRTAADIADLLGETADAQRFRSIAAKVRDGLNTYLLDGDRYADCLGSSNHDQAASVFALYFDVVPAASRQAVLDYVKGLGFSVQVYAGWYLTQLLYDEDEGDLVYELMDQTQGQWGRMVDEGATTTWESWDGMYSRSHAWSGYPMAFLKSGLLGVEPTAPGYASFRVRPWPATLAMAQGTVPTVKGDVFVRFQRTGSGHELEVRVPANTAAEVCVPKLALASPSIREGGRLVWSAGVPSAGPPAGVTPLEDDGTHVRFAVGSGTYVFEVR